MQVLRGKKKDNKTHKWKGYQSVPSLHKHEGLVGGHDLDGPCANTIAQLY